VGIDVPSSDPARLVVVRAGAVDAADGLVPWVLVDAAGDQVVVASEFLRAMVANDFRASSIRSYALALLRWLRFLWAVDVRWDRVTANEVRDFVLWMRAAEPARPAMSRARPGSTNLKTGKRYLDRRFAPATINHNLAVVSAFYAFHLSMGAGPLVNPVPERVHASQEVSARRSPLQPRRHNRRAAYRQRVTKVGPRAMPDRLFDELFEAMTSHRDRAILAFYVSCGARPSELLGLTRGCLDYGGQLIRVTRKGSQAVQWIPASPDAFVWLALYQSDLPAELVDGDTPVWWTLRRPLRRLDYDAMRAVLRRANEKLQTNWSLHDLRHTFAIRMASDPKVPLVSLQVLLGHAHLASTQRYLVPHLEQVIAHAREHYRRPREAEARDAAVLGYDSADMAELFGWRGEAPR